MSATDAKTEFVRKRSPAVLAASILYFAFGLGTLLSEIPAIAYMIQNRAFPVVFGIPLMGNSFSERLGIDFTIRAASAFAVVNALEILAGYLLWKSDKRGRRLGLILLPVALPFWIMFEIPAFVVIGPARLLTLVVWDRGGAKSN